MTMLTLSARIYSSHQLRELEKILSGLLGDLSLQYSIAGTVAGRWAQVDVAGEDEAVATRLLEREAGFCPINLENVRKFSSHTGYVVNLEQSKEEVMLDFGVFEPKTVHASVKLASLQAELPKSNGVPLKKLAQMWAICENLPLEFKVLEVNIEKYSVKATLQPDQIRRFIQWRDSLLDRLLIMGASLGEVSAAVDQAGLMRDVVEVERLGMFEYALVCKLGTDAAGLIGRIGRLLRKARFTVFNPKPLNP